MLLRPDLHMRGYSSRIGHYNHIQLLRQRTTPQACDPRGHCQECKICLEDTEGQSLRNPLVQARKDNSMDRCLHLLILLKFPSCVGIIPLRVFPDKDRCSKDSSFPSWLGMVPLMEPPEIWRNLNLDKLPISLGIVPIKKFPSTWK